MVAIIARRPATRLSRVADLLGVQSGTTEVRTYDPRWREEFEREAENLRQLLLPVALQIEHIGSTAVPGLAAKPLVDIALAFSDRSALEHARRLLQAKGYEDRGDWGADGGVIVAKGPRSGRTHMLHLVEITDGQWFRYLAFRDALRADDAQRDAYAALKIDLAARYPEDRTSYVRGKRDFIEATIARASLARESST